MIHPAYNISMFPKIMNWRKKLHALSCQAETLKSRLSHISKIQRFGSEMIFSDLDPTFHAIPDPDPPFSAIGSGSRSGSGSKSDTQPFCRHFSAFFEYFLEEPNKWRLFYFNIFVILILFNKQIFMF